MAQNNFILDLIAGLKKSQSKKQIKADIKSLGDIYIKLVGNLNISKTIADANKKLKGWNATFTINPNINTKGLQTATNQAMNNAQKAANKKRIKVNFELDKQQLLNKIKILG